MELRAARARRLRRLRLRLLQLRRSAPLALSSAAHVVFLSRLAKSLAGLLLSVSVEVLTLRLRLLRLLRLNAIVSLLFWNKGGNNAEL